MEKIMIKVLWIEDDLEVFKAFRETAYDYSIEFIHSDNWIDGKKLLKEQFKEISAIIFDAHCKWDKGSIADDKFLSDVLSELWELFGKADRSIPWYILSAGTMNNYGDVIGNANNRKRHDFDIEWGRADWLKTFVMSQEDNNPLLSQILKSAENQTHNIILRRHHDTFKYLGTDGNICKGARAIMFNALSALYAPEENIGFEFQGNPIRKVLEHMIRHANKIGIIPDAFFDERNNPKMADCVNFLCGGYAQHVKIRLWNPENNESFAIFPKPLSYYLQNVLYYSNNCSHSEEDEDIAYINSSYEKDLFFAMVLHLSHLIAHYGGFVDSHRDIEKNRQLSRPVPEDIAENSTAGDPIEMIEHVVEGPICIDGQRNPYIRDVQLHESYRLNAGQTYHTKQVYPNTGKYKDKYQFFASQAFLGESPQE